MPSQKRPAPSEHLPAASDDSPPSPPETDEQHPEHQQGDGEQPPASNPPPEQDDSDAEGGSPSSHSAADKDEFIVVRLADIRREVQCPICLGIIRKTRTVMECLHRFCRECIDKSMRLGNNECPACRTHCASRRSLRDDPNYDALIAALYPDIDQYEKEELAFHEEEKTRNMKIQASISETFRRQSEALVRRRTSPKATTEAFVRKSQGSFRSSCIRGRGKSGDRDTALVGSDDDEEEDANGNGIGKDSSSPEERSPELRPKRFRRCPGPRSSPARTAGNSDMSCEKNDDRDMSRENLGKSLLRVGNREFAWGKGGARSQTRHGNSSGLNGRYFKGGRTAKLLEHLRNLDDNDDQFDVHLTLLPLDERSMPPLERPYLFCQLNLSIRFLCEFIALQTSAQAEEVEILVREPQDGTLPIPLSSSVKVENEPSEKLQILGLQESLAGLLAFTSNEGNLVLLYRLKMQS